MADDPKDPKDDSAKAQVLMTQLSGVLNNPVMRSLMSAGTFTGEAAKGKPADAKAKAPVPSGPGMMPSKPLPPIQPIENTPAAGGVMGAISQLPKEKLVPMLEQLKVIVVEMDQMMKALAKLKGGNPALKKQIRMAVGQIVQHLPALIVQIQAQLAPLGTPEAKQFPELMAKIQEQLKAVDRDLDDSQAQPQPTQK
jgi:hypothetical protein